MNKFFKAFIAIVLFFNFGICFILLQSKLLPEIVSKSNSSINPLEPQNAFGTIPAVEDKVTKDKEIETTNQEFTNNTLTNFSSAQPKSVTKCPIIVQEYSEEEIKEIWKFRTYGKCNNVLDHSISVSGSVVTVECFNGATAVLGYDTSNSQIMSAPSRNTWYRGNVKDIGNSQYLFVKCYSTISSYVFNTFNQAISDRAKKTSEKFSENSKPLSVLLIVLDSVSRGSFYRNLKSTANYLKKEMVLEFNHKYKFYDFEYNNPVSLNTKPNMAQILYGHTLEDHQNILGPRVSLNNYKYLELQNKSIWKYFSSLGYVTYISIDSVYEYMPQLIGREILADHALTNFWTAASRVYPGFGDFLEDQRCLGSQNAHWYQLNYTYQFYKNYKGNHKFAYIHSTAAHEDTGNVQTLDEDIKEFLKKMLALHNDTGEDFVLFMISDHGRGVRNENSDPRLYFDHRVPFTSIITNTDLEDRLGSKDFLKYNTEQLIGRLDIHLTLKSLAWAPYTNTPNDYDLWKSEYSVKGTSSLFHEFLNENRTCDDLKIDASLCICNDFKEVDIYGDDEILIIQNILKLSTDYIDSKLYNRNSCQSLVIKDVEAKKFNFNGKNDGSNKLYKVNIFAQNNSTLEVSAGFLDIDWTKGKSSNILNDPDHPIAYFVYQGTQVLVRIVSISIKSTCSQYLCICR
jgi:Protein of unknown function (DUF229)